MKKKIYMTPVIKANRQVNIIQMICQSETIPGKSKPAQPNGWILGDGEDNFSKERSFSGDDFSSSSESIWNF